MDPQQHRPTTGARESPRKGRDTSSRFGRSRTASGKTSAPTAVAEREVDLRSGRELKGVDDELRLDYLALLANRDAIDRERQKYFELFDFAPDAYFITDARGAIREANVAATQLLGVQAQFLAGKSLPAFFEEPARKVYRHQLDQLSGSERSDDWEISIQPRNGRPTAVTVSIGRIARKDDSVLGYRWVVRDISKRKQAENAVRELNRDLEIRVASRTTQLAAANRVKSDFLALLSHEFRTPLQAIFGYTELLEREIHGPLNEAQRRDLQRIQQSQQHLLGLITTILDFAKIESGRSIDVSLRPTVVDEVLGHMEGLVGAQLEEKELCYTYRCGDPSIVAYTDAAKMQQILLNLLANAIKFTDRGGSITLDCELEPDAVAIHVVDTGRGIPADRLDDVFQPFVQLSVKGAVTNGTGLGLPISRKLATAMGGSLNATSELGTGSTFTLRLQRALDPDNTPRAS